MPVAMAFYLSFYKNAKFSKAINIYFFYYFKVSIKKTINSNKIKTLVLNKYLKVAVKLEDETITFCYKVKTYFLIHCTGLLLAREKKMSSTLNKKQAG